MSKANWSPIQLRHYYFIRLSVIAREEVLSTLDIEQAASYPAFDDITLEPEVTLFSSDEGTEQGPYMLRLSIAHQPDKESTFPYTFDVVLEGVIEATEPDKLEDPKRLVVINGAGMLYSAAREQLLALTSRHLYGALMLPTLNFQHLEV